MVEPEETGNELPRLSEGQWNTLVTTPVLYGELLPLARTDEIVTSRKPTQKSEPLNGEIDGGKDADSYKLLPPRGNA